MPGGVDEPVAIIGPGRMGRGLGRALEAVGVPVSVLGRRRDPNDTRRAALVLITTPDDTIGSVAAELARDGGIGSEQVVLHVSGLLDRLALHALADAGAGLGSFHPLQSIADPETAPERLAGAWVGLEGDDRALQAGERLATTLRMRAVRLAPGGKTAYHAGAVFASNFLVVLAGVAQTLARRAGVPASDAAELYLPLMRGTLANLPLGPAAALTGPIRRGDEATVRAHLAALSPDQRRLYRELGAEALKLARADGLEAGAAAAVERALAGAG